MGNIVYLEDLLSTDPATTSSEATPTISEYPHFPDPRVLVDIDQALFHGVAPKPNLATQAQKLESTNFVHELDRITQAIISGILEAQKTIQLGDVPVPETAHKVHLL